MKALIVYDTRYGNTEHIARNVGDTLKRVGPVEVISVHDLNESRLKDVELVIVGSPTYDGLPSRAVMDFIEHFPQNIVRGLSIAAFDTRQEGPRFATGAVAGYLSDLLRREGAWELVPPESFVVKGREGPLLDGEVTRAVAWGDQMANAWKVRQLTGP